MARQKLINKHNVTKNRLLNNEKEIVLLIYVCIVFTAFKLAPLGKQQIWQTLFRKSQNIGHVVLLNQSASFQLIFKICFVNNEETVKKLDCERAVLSN